MFRFCADVLLILQAHDSKNCQEFYKYVKRSADRFIDLGFGETVEITKFDVERYLLRSTLVRLPVRFKLGGRPILSAHLSVETARSERKRPEV